MSKILNNLNKVNYVFIVFIISYFSFSPINNLLPYNMFVIVSILWGIANILNYMNIKRYIILNKFLLLFLIIVFIKMLFVKNYQPISEYHSLFSLFGLLFIVAIMSFVLHTLNSFDSNSKKSLYSIFFISFNTSIFIGIIHLLLYGSIYRNSLYLKYPLMPSVTFVFISVLIALLCYYFFLSQKAKKYLVLCILNFAYVILASYTTQLLFLVIGIIAITINQYVKINIKKLGISLVIVLIFIILFHEQLGNGIVTLFNSNFFDFIHPDIKVRIIDIGVLLSGNVSDTIDISLRFDLIATSLESFFKYPIFGIPFNLYNVGNLNVGGHAQWFDSLARYGLLGCSLFVGWIWDVRSIFFNKKYLGNIICIIFVILYGFFNPIIAGNLFFIVFFSTMGLPKIPNIVRRMKQ